MQSYTSALLRTIRLFASTPIQTAFQSLCRYWIQGRAARHDDNRNSLLFVSDIVLTRPCLFTRSAVLTAFCVFTLSAPVLAQDQTQAALTEPAATRIEVDEQHNVIRFFIAGQERAILDTDGLHVREDIRFGGTAKDSGQAAFDQRTAGGAHAQ